MKFSKVGLDRVDVGIFRYVGQGTKMSENLRNFVINIGLSGLRDIFSAARARRLLAEGGASHARSPLRKQLR